MCSAALLYDTDQWYLSMMRVRSLEKITRFLRFCNNELACQVSLPVVGCLHLSNFFLRSIGRCKMTCRFQYGFIDFGEYQWSFQWSSLSDHKNNKFCDDGCWPWLYQMLEYIVGQWQFVTLKYLSLTLQSSHVEVSGYMSCGIFSLANSPLTSWGFRESPIEAWIIRLSPIFWESQAASIQPPQYNLGWLPSAFSRI